MIYIGIDPGASGALVGINEHMEVVLLHPYIGPRAAFDCVKGLATEKCAVLLEQVGAMRKRDKPQGSKSMVTFGKNIMAWQSPLEGFRISYEEVLPQKWQRAILGAVPTGESKVRALAFARKRFPKLELDYAVSNSKQQGIVDALCMAVYMRAKYYQDNPGHLNKE